MDHTINSPTKGAENPTLANHIPGDFCGDCLVHLMNPIAVVGMPNAAIFGKYNVKLENRNINCHSQL